MNSKEQFVAMDGYKALDNYDSSKLEELDSDIALDILINQIEFVRMLSKSRNIGDLSQRILKVLASLGFSDFSIIRTAPGWAVDNSLTSLPDDLVNSYQEQLFYEHDMALDYLMTGCLNPVYHSTISRVIDTAPLLTHTFERNQELLELYKRFGYHNALLIPVELPAAKVGEGILFLVLAKGLDSQEFLAKADRCKPVLQLLADAVNFINNARFGVPKTRCPMPPRPKRLLTIMAKYDLTLSETAGQLGISIDTANKHMAMAKKCLGTSSQANAVFLALKKGLIDFSDDVSLTLQT